MAETPGSLAIPSAEDEDFNYRFNSVSFQGKEGWIIGKPAILLHTSDGWKELGENNVEHPTSWEYGSNKTACLHCIRTKPSNFCGMTHCQVYVKATGEQSTEMVTDEGAIYVTSNRGYNWKSAVQETVSAILNR
jgi:photosystem II stability/assembly factor-like uncharacterized protein